MTGVQTCALPIFPKKSIFDPNSNGEFGVGGEFGIFGGQYVPETLMPILKELEATYSKYRFDKEFWGEVNYYLKDYVGRENPLYFAKNISDELGAKIYLKREDLNHTGAHKVNNVIAQGLLAKKMGKTKVIAETLMPILKELEATYSKYRFDKEFWAEVNYYLKDYVGRENPLYFAKNISDELGAKIYLKREDLNHTGAHKVNNVIAQVS